MNKVIFQAKKIITMNPSLPEAEYLAQENGRIVSVGPYDAIKELLGEYTLDTRFKDNIIVPGFVEGHAHLMEGSVWQYLYVGFYDRIDPNGKMWPGVTDIQSVQERLAKADRDLPKDIPLIAWGFDPIFFNETLTRYHIDEVVDDRLVVIVHTSFHMITVNSLMLEKSGLINESSIEGVVLDKNNKPNGELQEMSVMGKVFTSLEVNMFDCIDEESIYNYGKSATRVGVTTATDLFNSLSDSGVKSLFEVTQKDNFPIRLVPAMSALNYEINDGIEKVLSLKEKNTDKLFFGSVKLMTDGSIQGFTARLMYPGYHKKSMNGIWNSSPEYLTEVVHAYHQAGINLHIHTNGDEASQLMIESIESAITMVPWMNHRHTLQHCQLVNQAQIKRIANANICMNIFANHIYYWGDQHLKYTVGFERAQRMEPLHSALNHGIVVAIHSDAPVTPLNPLFSMSCAVNRATASGQCLGEFEKVDVLDALAMVTINPAYTLHLDHLIGSLECGKFSDFTVLNKDPLTCESMKLKDIEVISTVLGGKIVYVK